MREALAARDNERFRIRAAVSRRGKRRTILLVDGVDASSGESLFDHLWMKIGKWARVPEGTDWRAIRSELRALVPRWQAAIGCNPSTRAEVTSQRSVH